LIGNTPEQNSTLAKAVFVWVSV